MARLMPGENAKIDHINGLVDRARDDDKLVSADGIDALLKLFHPMILKICKKWSDYFRDETHTIKPWDVLVADAQYWFIIYTKEKYTPNGEATYNNFIKNHINQRVRYIYECELKYVKQNVFPDPDKHGEDDGDMFDSVARNYGKIATNEIDILGDIVDDEYTNKRMQVYAKIMKEIDNRQYFNERESRIFNECMVNGRTHEDVGRQFGISRTRVSQIMNKIRVKINDILDDSIPCWWGD